MTFFAVAVQIVPILLAVFGSLLGGLCVVFGFFVLLDLFVVFRVDVPVLDLGGDVAAGIV